MSWSFVCNGSSVSPFHLIKHGGSYNAGTLVVVRHVPVYHLHFLVQVKRVAFRLIHYVCAKTGEKCRFDTLT